MMEYERIEDICGWVLPSGHWMPCEPFWHVSSLYEWLRSPPVLGAPGPQDTGTPERWCVPPELALALGQGDESLIRERAAQAGLLKVWQNTWDGLVWTEPQLLTLQRLYGLIEPGTEVQIFQQDVARTVLFPLERLLKARTAQVIKRLFL